MIALRKLYQRCFTALPHRIENFDAMFSPASVGRAAITAHPAGFTGILRSEPPRPVRIADPNGTYFSAEPARTLYSLAGGTVYSENGFVYFPGRRSFVAETFESWLSAAPGHSALAAPGFPAVTDLAGSSYLLASLGSAAFYHFLIDCLPRLLWARDVARECDHLLVGGHGRRWKARWLELLGCAPRARYLEPLAHVRCAQLIFTNRVVRHFEPSAWAVNLLRGCPELQPPESGRGPETLWLDRRGSPARAFGGEDALLRLFPGATPVRLEDSAPLEAIALCRGARVLIGLHGSALANMVFCRPGATIVELSPEPHFPWYARLAQVCGHRHLALPVGPDTASQLAAAAAAQQFISEL